MEINKQQQQQHFRDLFGSLQQDQEPISWDAAYKRMKRDNLSLRQSHDQLEEAGRLAQRRWLNLVPRMSSFVGIGSSISDLTDLSTDEISGTVSANLNIPNPFEFYASLYAAALQKQNAIWSHELDQRRAFTQLYSAFIEAEKIQEAEEAYERRFTSLVDARSEDIGESLEVAKVEFRALERRKLSHQLTVNQLLNTPGKNWQLSEKFPHFSYRKHYKNIKIGENFGKLALNLKAIQIEAAILRVAQVKFQQWPFVNFSLSTPALYSTSGSDDFSSDNLILFASASKSVDLTDVVGRESIRNAETRLALTREQLKLQLEGEASRILVLSKTYDELLEEHKELLRNLERMDRSGSSEPEVVLREVDKRFDLELELIENERRIQQLDLQFIIWDESYWN